MTANRFLLVEGDRATADRIGRTFAAVGYHCESVRTAAEAIAKAKLGGYSTVLIAERLPDGDGLDCFARLRRVLRKPLGILLAEKHDVSTVFSAVNYGIQHVVPKPIDVADLMDVLQSDGVRA